MLRGEVHPRRTTGLVSVWLILSSNPFAHLYPGQPTVIKTGLKEGILNAHGPEPNRPADAGSDWIAPAKGRSWISPPAAAVSPAHTFKHGYLY